MVWACRTCCGGYHSIAAMGGVSRRCTSTGGERRAAYQRSPLGAIIPRWPASRRWATALDQNSPIVMCPGCDEPMKPVDQKPVLSTDGLVEVTYFCETCHTKTVRTIKPGDGPASR